MCLFGDIAVGAVDYVVSGKVIPISALEDGFPLGFGAFEINVCQEAAAFECSVTNVGDIAGDPEGCHTVATVECAIANAGDAFANGGAGQTCTVAECVFTEMSDAVGDDNRCKAGAIFKCESSNIGDTVGDADFGHAGATGEGPVADRSGARPDHTRTADVFLYCDHMVSCVENTVDPICLVVVVTRVIKDTTFHAGDTVGEGNAGQTGATVECVSVDGDDTVGDGNACQTGAVPKCKNTDRSRSCFDSTSATDGCFRCNHVISCVENTVFPVGFILVVSGIFQHVFANVGDAVGEGNVIQGGATGERYRRLQTSSCRPAESGK